MVGRGKRRNFDWTQNFGPPPPQGGGGERTGEEVAKVEENIVEEMELAEIPATNHSTSTRKKSEFNYIQLLNRLLPPTLRILAWSPVSPTFSARFNCKSRHYKYFFLSKGLDLAQMRDGAERLVGEHDFRNLCKLDPGKQMSNFRRRVVSAEINPVGGDVYVLDLVGRAFLYHQVRHIMAILFLVGTGLEHPSVVSSLLNVDADPAKLTSPLLVRDGDPPIEVVDRKPEYQMADALPLMLWECRYADTDLRWRTTPGDDDEVQEERRGSGSELHDQMNSIHERSIIHTVLDAHFLEAAMVYHPEAPVYFPRSQRGDVDLPSVIQVQLGGGRVHRNGNYRLLLGRKRMEAYEVINERWRIIRLAKSDGTY